MPFQAVTQLQSQGETILAQLIALAHAAVRGRLEVRISSDECLEQNFVVHVLATVEPGYFEEVFRCSIRVHDLLSGSLCS